MSPPEPKDAVNEKVKQDIKPPHDKDVKADPSHNKENLNTDQTKTTENPTDKATTSESHGTEEHTAKEKILKEEKVEGPKLREKLATSSPMLSKVVEYCIDSLEETFPSERYHKKFAKARQEAKVQAQTLRQELQKEYTEEELLKVNFFKNWLVAY